jgi:Zn-dependent protease
MTVYEASTWVIPVIIAITFHEAAHGFVALLFGDDTAWRLGRVFNPLKHIDRLMALSRRGWGANWTIEGENTEPQGFCEVRALPVSAGLE